MSKIVKMYIIFLSYLQKITFRLITPCNKKKFFCNVCGEFFAKRAKKHCLSNFICAAEAYLHYFGMSVGDQNKRWAPHVICDYCRRTLECRLRGEKRAIRFAIPRVWREPSNHYTDCCFCMVDPTKQKKGKNAPPIEYPNIPSSIAPVPHNTTDLPVPQPPYAAETSSEDSKMEEGAPSSSSSVICR